MTKQTKDDYEQITVIKGEYTLFAGPHGRKIAARIRKYKRKIFILKMVILSLLVTVGGLITYIMER